MVYSYDEVYKNTLDYFHGNKMLTTIWLSKYCLKDNEGNYLEKNPDERLKTICKEIARVELSFHKDWKGENSNKALEFEQNVYELIKDFGHFILGGSIMYGIGNDNYLTSLGNCFVVGNDTDSYGSICMIDQEQIQIMKRRGGVGHDLSHLRPRGSSVNGCASTSTGAFSFAPRFSNSTREVAQEGRRGALMLTAHINHPDIIEFIELKDDTSKNTGCNISVKLTDEFMQNVEKGTTHFYKFPVDSKQLWGDSKIDARELFNKIVHQAWKNGEPGVLFWDTVIKESVADCYVDEGFKTVSTNPCGEIPLSPYDSCRLAHLNLYSYVVNPFTKEAYFDMSNFKKDASLVMRIMDDILVLEEEKINKIIKSIETSCESIDVKGTELVLWKKVILQLRKGRRTGIGILGLADCLAALNLQYGSDKANEISISIQKELAISTYKESIILAQERGSFPIWDYDKEKGNLFLQRIVNSIDDESIIENYKKFGRRNISILTIAPTGTTSQFANRKGVSSGMEPVFEIAYKRRRKINSNDTNAKVDYVDEVGDKFEEYVVLHPIFKEWYRIFVGDKDAEEINRMTFEEIKNLISESPYYKATANEIDVISKIKLQGQLQKWIDHSISVTHNLPENTTEEEIYNYYFEAWKCGCKGCTVYRDGSRSGVLIRESKKELEQEVFHYEDAPKRPAILNCEIHRLQALKENWFILVELYNGLPFGIFAIKEKMFPSVLRTNAKEIQRGQIIKRKKKVYDLITVRPDNQEPIIVKDLVSLMDSLDDRADTKRFSLDLRHRINPKWIVETIEKQGKPITSFEKAITRVLKKYIPEGEHSGLVCENCGSTDVYYKSGCPYCRNCGWSHCG